MIKHEPILEDNNKVSRCEPSDVITFLRDSHFSQCIIELKNEDQTDFCKKTIRNIDIRKIQYLIPLK